MIFRQEVNVNCHVTRFDLHIFNCLKKHGLIERLALPHAANLTRRHSPSRIRQIVQIRIVLLVGTSSRRELAEAGVCFESGVTLDKELSTFLHKTGETGASEGGCTILRLKLFRPLHR